MFGRPQFGPFGYAGYRDRPPNLGPLRLGLEPKATKHSRIKDTINHSQVRTPLQLPWHQSAAFPTKVLDDHVPLNTFAGR